MNGLERDRNKDTKAKDTEVLPHLSDGLYFFNSSIY